MKKSGIRHLFSSISEEIYCRLLSMTVAQALKRGGVGGNFHYVIYMCVVLYMYMLSGWQPMRGYNTRYKKIWEATRGTRYHCINPYPSRKIQFKWKLYEARLRDFPSQNVRVEVNRRHGVQYDYQKQRLYAKSKLRVDLQMC